MSTVGVSDILVDTLNSNLLSREFSSPRIEMTSCEISFLTLLPTGFLTKDYSRGGL